LEGSDGFFGETASLEGQGDGVDRFSQDLTAKTVERFERDDE